MRDYKNYKTEVAEYEGTTAIIVAVGGFLGLIAIGGFIAYCKALPVIEAWMNLHRF